MKTTTKILIIVLSIAIVYSCAKAKNESAMERDEAPSSEMVAGAPVMDDSVSGNGFVSSSAARTDKDKGRKFIRTATMKFRVKNVIKSTYKIEEITAGFDGFVTYTNLASEMNNQTIVPISADSSLETIFFTVSNTFTLRVPNTNLDSTLRTIARLIDYLDYRTIEASDVSLEMLSNQITQNLISKHEERLKNAIDEQGKKLKETSAAEENLLYKQQLAKNARISNMKLQDQIDFSTINLTIYQRQETKRWIIANDKNIDEYKPGFGTKLLDSLKFGWKMLEALLVFIVKLWGLFLFGFILYFLIAKFGYLLKIKRNKKQ